MKCFRSRSFHFPSVPTRFIQAIDFPTVQHFAFPIAVIIDLPIPNHLMDSLPRNPEHFGSLVRTHQMNCPNKFPVAFHDWVMLP